jgi:transmembrane sensor
VNQNKLKILYAKLVSREISNRELDALLAYFEASDLTELEAMIARQLELTELPEAYPETAILTGQRVLAKLKYEIGREAAPPRKVKLWQRIAVTAAVATFLFGAGLFYYRQSGKQDVQTELAVSGDVAPGKQGATLTLASGKKIRLADAANGELARQAGVTVSKLASGQLVYELKSSEGTGMDLGAVNTLSTAKGETYHLRLPDGSMVWLNAASSLTYDANLLAGGQRRVHLTGEAYFEIKKDKTHPFVVESPGQQVEVLGTHFNINSYANEPTAKTTLLEGLVQLNHRTILKPGEQATVRASGGISITQVDVEEAVAWKNGKFIFADENIESIMRKLERWYNVEVSYEGVPPEETFTASIGRFDNISKILNKLSYTNNVHFKIEGRRILVMK